MAKSQGQSLIRILADRYDAHMGTGTIYSGRDEGKRHYFSDGVIYGDVAALAYMTLLCVRAGVPTE